MTGLPRPSPAIVPQVAARPLPRWVLWGLAWIYVLVGLGERQPWRGNDLAAFGAMLDLVAKPSHWAMPQILGQGAEVTAHLPYWLGAGFIHALPFLPADIASRVPFAGLLGLTLWATWGAAYHLALLPSAQPVSFAFGGEARATDYARALADGAVLALLATLGLAQLAHEATPDTAQLAASTLLLYACARLMQQPGAGWRVWWVWGLGWLGLTLSGAPWYGSLLASLWYWGWRWQSRCAPVQAPAAAPFWWWVGLLGLNVGLVWVLGLPLRHPHWLSPSDWTDAEQWRRYTRLLLWFAWPAGLLGLVTVWRWRQRLDSPHLWLPMGAAACGTLTCWLLDVSDRALLLSLPALACLTAFTLPTLRRSITALLDWFALLFFTGCAGILWFYWWAMQTGQPAKPAHQVLRLVPDFVPTVHVGPTAMACVATLAWLAAIGWRLGRYRPALWKGLVLSAGGSVLCWVLLMSLWLPVLNHGMSEAPISRRIAGLIPDNERGQACVLVHGLNATQITGLQYHGQLRLERANGSDSACRWLVVAPQAEASLPEVVKLSQWRALRKIPRLRENRDGLLAYVRR